MIDLSLILPVHNEEEIIKQVLLDIIKYLKSLKISYEIILVENGSTDNSLQVIKKLSKTLPNINYNIVPKGYGSAVIKGLENAKGNYVCYMPSDGQIDMNVFNMLWSDTKKERYDLVKVKRIQRESFLRELTTKSFSLIIMVLFNTWFIDINGSPRIFKRKHLNKLNLQSKDSFIDAEFLVKISRLKWKIKEIPMKNLDRVGGSSTRSINTYIEFLRNIYKFKTSNFFEKWLKEIN